jgi:hypothetical protein
VNQRTGRTGASPPSYRRATAKIIARNRIFTQQNGAIT